jgi:hypothetical protein
MKEGGSTNQFHERQLLPGVDTAFVTGQALAVDGGTLLA